MVVESVEFVVCLRDGGLRYVASHRFLLLIIITILDLFFLGFFIIIIIFFYPILTFILWCVRCLGQSHGRQ